MLLDELTEEQILEWVVYDSLDPIGDFRSDYRNALLCSTICNIAIRQGTAKGRIPQYTKISDFMPDWGNQTSKQAKKQTIEEMKMILKNTIPSSKKK